MRSRRDESSRIRSIKFGAATILLRLDQPATGLGWDRFRCVVFQEDINEDYKYRETWREDTRDDKGL